MASRTPATEEQPQQPQEQPRGLGPVEKTIIAGGAAAVLLSPGAAAATGVAAGAAEAPAVLSAGAIAAVVAAATKGLVGYAGARRASIPEEVSGAVRLAHPERTQREIDKLAELEVAYENAFLSKMKVRLARDLAKALAIADPAERRAAVQAVLERERRYVDQRQQAVLDRALARSEALAAKKLSPKGAYWWLSPLVFKHTPDCLALGEQFWPWSVIEDVGPPPRHHGCRCQLLTLEEAVGRGLMTAGQADVDAAERLKSAKAALKKAEDVMEAVNEDEWRLWVAIISEGDPLELVEAAWATRWPAGTAHGGRFKPRRGGDPGALARRAARRGLRKAAADLLARHFPHYPMPPRVMRHAGAETVVGPHRVYVPHGRSFARTIGGHRYTSPPGTVELFRDGEPYLDPRTHGPSALHGKGQQAVLTPVEPSPGTGGEVELPLEIPSGVAGRAREFQRTRGEAFDLQIASRAKARDPALPPVLPGQDGSEAHAALSRAGFVETGVPSVADRITIPYVAPDGASTLEVVYGPDGAIETAHWRPRRPARRGRELERPPADFQEFADDLRAFGDRVALQELGPGHRSWLNEIRVGDGKPDHAAEQLWNGDVELGDDFRPDLHAAAAARASGERLGPTLLRGLWAATQSSHHEALHGVNPIGPQDYDDPAERALEEALVEELSHVEAALSLRRQGQGDAAQWALDHPGDAKVVGTYLEERAALAAIADRLGVPPEEREAFLRDLKFRVLPGTRAEWLAAMLAGGEPTEAQTEAVRGLMASPPDDARVAPILAIPGQPSPDAGHPSPAGDVWPGDRVAVGGRRGTVMRVHDGEGTDPWTAAVLFDDGSADYAVLPTEVRTVEPGPRGAAPLPAGGVVRQGDTVAWEGGEARIDRVLASSPGYVALDATAISGGRPGKRVILTPASAPGLRLAGHQADAAPAAPRPQERGVPADVEGQLNRAYRGRAAVALVPGPADGIAVLRVHADDPALEAHVRDAVGRWADATGTTVEEPRRADDAGTAAIRAAALRGEAPTRRALEADAALEIAFGEAGGGQEFDTPAQAEQFAAGVWARLGGAGDPDVRFRAGPGAGRSTPGAGGAPSIELAEGRRDQLHVVAALARLAGADQIAAVSRELPEQGDAASEALRAILSPPPGLDPLTRVPDPRAPTGQMRPAGRDYGVLPSADLEVVSDWADARGATLHAPVPADPARLADAGFHLERGRMVRTGSEDPRLKSVSFMGAPRPPRAGLLAGGSSPAMLGFGGFLGLGGRRNAVAVADYLGSRIAERHSYGSPDFDAGYAAGLREARRVVAVGGQEAELLELAKAHGPLKGGGDRNLGYQDAVRHAYFEVEADRRRDNLALFYGKANKAPHVRNEVGGDSFPRSAGDPLIPGDGLPEGLELAVSDAAPRPADRLVFYGGPKRVTATVGGREVGSLTVSRGHVTSVIVREDLRRRGIASAMLDRARAEWGEVEHDDPEGRTPMGDAFARGKPNQPSDVWDDSHTVSITKKAGGTTGAMFATDKDGTKWLVKRYGGKVDRVAAEWLSNRVYAALGIKVAEAQTLDFGGVPALAYPLVDGVPGGNHLVPKAHRLLGRGFMADALVANWDVVGFDHDNLLWPPGTTAANLDGQDPFRVDQGGSFEYRAQGAPKPYGPVPTEVWTMANGQGQAFGRMDLPPAVKRDGAAAIANRLTDAVVDELVDAAPFKDAEMRERIRVNLKARVDWMRQYARGVESYPPGGKPNQPTGEPPADPKRLRPGDRVRDPAGNVYEVEHSYEGGVSFVGLGQAPRKTLKGWRFVPPEAPAPAQEPHVNPNTIEPGERVRGMGGVWEVVEVGPTFRLRQGGTDKLVPSSSLKQYTVAKAAGSPYIAGGRSGKRPPEPKPLEGADARSRLRAAQEKVALMPEEAAALGAYSQGWADAVNDSLRTGKPEEASDELKKLVRELDSITRFIRTKDATTLYAALPPGELKPNQKVQEKGYLTLTTRLDEAQRAAGEDGNVLRLLVPSGANAAYLPAWDELDAPADAEVLLPRGSQLVIRRQEGKVIDAALVAPARASYTPPPPKRLEDAPGTDSVDPGSPKPHLGKKLGGAPLKQADGPAPFPGEAALEPPAGPTYEAARAEWERKNRFKAPKKPPAQPGGAPPPQGKLHGWLPSWLGGGHEPDRDLPKPAPPSAQPEYGPGRSAGVIVTEPDGRVWFYEPKNHYGGYIASLSKGHVDGEESAQEAALRELYEETGLQAEITGEVGSYLGDTTITQYFTGRRIGGAPWKVGTPEETWAVKLARPEDAAKVLKPRDVLALQDAGILPKPPPEPPSIEGGKPEAPSGKPNFGAAELQRIRDGLWRGGKQNPPAGHKPTFFTGGKGDFVKGGEIGEGMLLTDPDQPDGSVWYPAKPGVETDAQGQPRALWKALLTPDLAMFWLNNKHGFPHHEEMVARFAGPLTAGGPIEKMDDGEGKLAGRDVRFWLVKTDKGEEIVTSATPGAARVAAEHYLGGKATGEPEPYLHRGRHGPFWDIEKDYGQTGLMLGGRGTPPPMPEGGWRNVEQMGEPGEGGAGGFLIGVAHGRSVLAFNAAMLEADGGDVDDPATWERVQRATAARVQEMLGRHRKEIRDAEQTGEPADYTKEFLRVDKPGFYGYGVSGANEEPARPGKANRPTGEWASGPGAGDVMWTGWRGLKPGDRVVSYRQGKVLAAGEVERVFLPKKGVSQGVFGVRVKWDNGVSGRVSDPSRNLRREEGPLEPPTGKANFVDPNTIPVDTDLGPVTFRSSGDQVGPEYHATYAAVTGDGNVVGRIDVSYLGGEAAIQMIEVPEENRRKGVASALVQRVKNEQPGVAISTLGDVTTPEGRAFVAAGRRRSGKANEPVEAVVPKPWLPPPPPAGRKAVTVGGFGYSSDRAYGTNTRLGQAGEEAFVQIVGGEILHPPGKGAQSPLDARYDGLAFEVKTVSTKSQGYKATPKPFEVAQKQAHAAELGLAPALAIVVVDSDAGLAHAYYRDGLEGGRLSERTGWKYLGSAPVEPAGREKRLLERLRAADRPRAGKANAPAGATPLEAAAAKGVDLKAAFAPGDASPAHPQRSEYRMRGAAAILEAHAERKNAVLELPDDKEKREQLVKAIASGDIGRALKEYRETPLADLEVLSKITVADHPVSGQAHANLGARSVTMGSTSKIGDFRHELGHTLRAAMSGAAAPMGHTPLTDYVAQRHADALARVKANIAAGKPKPKTHLEWEEQTGLGGRRGKDSWEEDFAEQYRGYQKAVFQARHAEDAEHDPQALEKYRARHPEWARFWDAWYTAQLAGRGRA